LDRHGVTASISWQGGAGSKQTVTALDILLDDFFSEVQGMAPTPSSRAVIRLHFKNLVAKHIGAELSKYIRFVILSMDGKTVGVVRCGRASEPVFLKQGALLYPQRAVFRRAARQ